MLLSQILTRADAFPQFLVSKIAVGPNGIISKHPCNPQGVKSDHASPANWMTLSSAETLAKRLGPDYFVGFSITAASQYFLLDIDHCILNGVYSPLAVELCKTFEGCYIEVSQSGTGLHIIGRYSQPFRHKNKNTSLGIELYTDKRFVMLTGTQGRGDWNKDVTVPLLGVAVQYFKADETPEQTQAVVPPPPPTSTGGELSDDQVIANAYADGERSARGVFGAGSLFKALFEGDTGTLSKQYPPQSQGQAYGESEADLGLANILAKHTNSNRDQMIRIMWRSALVREKWYRKTYLLDTCNKAISSRHMLLSQQGQSTPSAQPCQEINQNIPQEFHGSYYVIEAREIYHPHYGFLNQDAFNMVYGGRPFPESPASSNTTTNAYKSFKNHAGAASCIVDGVGFRPTLPYGAILEHEGQKRLNIYKTLPIKSRGGDMKPFYRFFNPMIPNQRDQRILLSFVARMVQTPGVQSHWAPVIHGVQGCGKSLLADLVSYACGQRYTHRVKGDEFENRFNVQWFGKTLLLVEDPQLRQVKLEEALKPLIGASSIAYEGKGKGIVINDFAANFIITTNDIGLIQKREYTRRFAVFMSALQSVEDLLRAGLTPSEFRNIVDWKDKYYGYEIFTDAMLNYHIDPEFDFAGTCVVAPHTSTTDIAIEASRPEIELRLLEQVEQGRIGFKNGWISSVALSDFLNQNRLNHLMPNRRRADILKEIGYIPHPAFGGLQIPMVLEKHGRPRLFIKVTHPIFKNNDTRLIAEAFVKDQERD